MGLLGGLWLHRNVRKSPEFAAHRCAWLRPERLHDLKPFDETSSPALAGDAEDRFRHVRTANSYAHNEPTVAQLIQRRQAFCQLNGVSNHRD
jgi:hypothetical protein